MSYSLMTFGIGVAFGLVCGVFSLPIPAPPTLAGVLGVVGVFAGFWLTKG